MMEYFWYIVASVLAGVGTGLVGLSAATVIVPILIVLCPSFAGETGAYQAAAIALASDILGSAVTTATYIKRKNIDLRRGWIMLVCIVGMCMLGSFAAWKAGNVLLGASHYSSPSVSVSGFSSSPVPNGRGQRQRALSWMERGLLSPCFLD